MKEHPLLYGVQETKQTPFCAAADSLCSLQVKGKDAFTHGNSHAVRAGSTEYFVAFKDQTAFCRPGCYFLKISSHNHILPY